jgi:hypothetical protein
MVRALTAWQVKPLPHATSWRAPDERATARAIR